MISKKVKEIAKTDQLKFDLKEGWGCSFIAIDRTKKILLFSKIVNGEVLIEKIGLDQVEKSTIHKKIKSERSGSSHVNILQKLDLEITFLASQSKAVSFNFYDAEDSYSEDYEMQRAEKWETVINEAVKAMSTARKVA